MNVMLRRYSWTAFLLILWSAYGRAAASPDGILEASPLQEEIGQVPDQAPKEMELSAPRTIFPSSSRLEILGYAIGIDFKESQPLGRLASTSSSLVGISELRLNASGGVGPIEYFVEPRFEVEGTESDSDLEVDLKLPQGGISVRTPFSGLELVAQRERSTTGAANFRSAGNLIYFDNGKSNPIRELPGVDSVGARFRPSEQFAVSAGYFLSDGDESYSLAPLKKSVILTVQYIGETYTLRAAPLYLATQRTFGAGLQGQVQATDSVLLYSEFSSRGKGRGLYPTSNSFPAFEESVRRSGSYNYALIGTTYTFESGKTLSLEYLYNDEGYDAADARRYSNRIDQAASDSRSNDPQRAGRGQFTLSQALNNGLPLLRRNYVHVQVGGNPFDNLIWQVRVTRNLDDDSQQQLLYVEKSIAGALSGLFLLAVNAGGRNTDYGGIVNYTSIVGLKAVLF